MMGMSVKYSNFGGMLDDAAMVNKFFDIVPDRFINVMPGSSNSTI